MLDNCVAAPAAATAFVTPVLSTNLDAVQSNHAAFDRVRCILYSIGSSSHLIDHRLNVNDFPCQEIRANC